RRFWEDANILMVGTGAYAGTTLAQLEARGAKNVAVHSSSGRAEEFVADRGGWAMALGGADVEGAVAEADVLTGVAGAAPTASANQPAALRAGPRGRRTGLARALTQASEPALGDLPPPDLLTPAPVKTAAPSEQPASTTQTQQPLDSAVDEYLT